MRGDTTNRNSVHENVNTQQKYMCEQYDEMITVRPRYAAPTENMRI